MAMSPEETEYWETLRLEVQAKGNTTLQLLALRYWGDKENSKGKIHQIVCAELAKRADKGAYTQEQIIAEYRRINPL